MGTAESSMEEQSNSKEDHRRKIDSKNNDDSKKYVNSSSNKDLGATKQSTPTKSLHQLKSSKAGIKSPERKNTVKVLKGVVCGHEKVGKSSLLYRLRGEDALHSPRRQKQRMMALIPWNMETSCPYPASDDKGTKHQSRCITSRSSVGAVQLHIVERHEDSYASTVETGHVDFIIFLVDRTRKDTLEYVIEYLNGIKELKETECECDMPSLCLLLNYYDASPLSERKSGVVEDSKRSDGIAMDKRSSQSKVPSSILDLERVQMIMKENFNDQLHVLCFDSCMINGYGLEALNYFMTVSYLRMMERDLLLQVKQVRSDLKVWENSFKTDMFTSFLDIEANQRIDVKSHDDKVDNTVLQKKEVTNRLDKVPTDDSSDHSKDPSNKEQSSRRKVMFKSDTEQVRFVEEIPQKNGSKQHSVNTRQPSQRTDNGVEPLDTQKVVPTSGRSQVKSQKPSRKVRWADGGKKGRGKRLPPIDPKMALEAFLASDDDSDNDSDHSSNGSPQKVQIVNNHHHHRGIRNADVLYSDSEDDSSHDSD